MRKILSLILGLLWALPALAALPSGYTQLEYIESTGKQYIDTGIEVNASKLTSGMRMELDIQFLSTNTKNGGNGVTAGPYFWIAYYHPGQLYCGLGSLYPTITVSQNIFSRHSYVLDSALKNFYIDDVLVESYDISEYKGVGKTNITLFSIGTTSFYVKQKLYKASIYQANNLVGNFIPAKRNSDGAVGLYDTVSGEFFENKGEGTFVAGPVVEIKIATTKYNETAFSPLNTALANAISVVDSVVSNTITQAGRIATLQAQKQTRPNDIADDNEKCPAGKKCLLVEDANGVPHWYEIVEPLLPAGYIQLQYIEATGRQYINTGILINKTLAKKLTLESEMLVTSTGGYRLCGIGGAESQFYFGLNPSTHFAYGSGITDADTNKIASLDTWYKYSYSPKNGKYTVRDSNDEVVTSTSFNFSENFSVKNYPILLFAYASGGSGGATGVWSGKISSFKVYEENVLIQDMVPARSASGVVGMYDLVSGQFFTNAGTGSFVAGPVAE